MAGKTIRRKPETGRNNAGKTIAREMRPFIHATTEAMKERNITPTPGNISPLVMEKLQLISVNERAEAMTRLRDVPGLYEYTQKLMEAGLESLALANMQRGITSAAWISGEFEGNASAPMLGLFPPEVITHSAEVKLPTINGIRFEEDCALFLRSTIIAVNAENPEPLMSILGMTLRYAAALTCAVPNHLFWIGMEGRRPNMSVSPMPEWLFDGMTSMYAYRIFEKNCGENPSEMTCLPEAAFASVLEKLAGKETMKWAYMNGDWTEIRLKINEALGKGTMESIVSAADKESMLKRMKKRLRASGPDKTNEEIMEALTVMESLGNGPDDLLRRTMINTAQHMIGCKDNKAGKHILEQMVGSSDRELLEMLFRAY